MHIKASAPAIQRVLLHFAGVVGDVIEQCQATLGKNRGEHFAGEMGEYLAIGQSAVHRRLHRAEIILAKIRMDRCTSEFAVRQNDAALRRCDHHFSQIVGAYLMAESPRAAMNADHEFPLIQSKLPGDIRGKNLLDFLYLEVMVARAERPGFIALPLLCLR